MAIQIKSTAKPAAKRGRPVGSKNRSTKTVTTGPDTPKRRGRPPGSKNKTTAAAKPAAKATTATRQRRSSKTDMTQAQLNKILKPLARDAAKRTSFHDQWKEYVASVNEQIIAALDAGVPVSLIVEHGDISRQHVYKLLEDAKKATNGSGPKTRAKAAATTAKHGPGRPKGSTNKAKPAPRATARKTTTTSKAKPKIRARS